MGKVARLTAMAIVMTILPALTMASAAEPAAPPVPVSKELKKQLLGVPVYIQILKEERTLELYGKIGHEYRLLDSYRICNFSGGLGPKRQRGDFKSPEGFYTVRQNQLKPDSRFYRAINIGFPNQYDRQQGYDGNYLMIHGDCVSVGCYAMTNAYMDEIFTYVDAALRQGQPEVSVSIYPFRMTESNMQRHRSAYHFDFWRQLQPGYRYFAEHHQPPAIAVINGRYTLDPSAPDTPRPFLTLTQVK